MSLPVYLLPGIGSDAGMFNAVMAQLKGVDFVAWNLPGYANAPALSGYGFPDLAQTVITDMDRRGIERAVLLGHSIGGMVAQEIAITHPGRVAGLILSGTTPAFGGRDDTFRREFLTARLKPLDGGMGMAGMATAFMPEIAGPKISADHLQAAIAAMGRIPEAAYRAAMACLVTFDRYGAMADYRCPILLVAGERDGNAPLKTMQKMAERMPGARLVTFEGVGHMAPLEVPDLFAAAVGDFLKEINP